MNKMFKKLMAVSATVAIAATMSVSAFAAGETATHTDGSVSVAGYAAVEGATQYTVMLFEDSFTTDYAVSKIYYINQGADPAALLADMLVKATTVDGVVSNDLPVGDYTVRIGNDKGSAVDVDLKVVADVEEPDVEEPKTTTLIFGDVNADEKITAADATYIAAYVTGSSANVGAIYDIAANIGDTGLVFGDVNGDGKITAADATYIAAYVTGSSASVGAIYNIGANYDVPVPVTE